MLLLAQQPMISEPSAGPAVRFGRASAIVAFAIGAFELIGCLVRSMTLRAPLIGRTPMAANTAIAVTLLAVGALLIRSRSRTRRRLALLVAAAVLLLAAAIVFEYIAGIDLGIDELIAPVKMALLTAVLLVAIGIAVVVLVSGVARRAATFLLTGVVVVSLFTVLGYLYGVAAYYQPTSHTPVALTTAVSLFLLSVAFLALSANQTWIHIFFIDDSPAAALARRITPAVILVTVLIGWIRDTAEDHGITDSNSSLAIVIVLNMTIFLALLIFQTQLLRNSEDRERERNARLAESEQRWRATFDLGAVGIAHVTTDGHFIAVNTKFCEMTGYSEDELVGRTVLEISAPESQAQTSMLIKDALSGSAPLIDFSKQYVRKDGSRMDARVSSTLVPSFGSGSHFLTFVKDVTLQKSAEDALRRSEARFRSLLENSHDITMIIDADNRVTYLSPSIKRVLGWDPEELIGTQAFRLIHRDDRPAVQAARDSIVERAGATVAVEYRHAAKDGTWRWFESVGCNLVGTPDIDGFVINSRDVTERRAYRRQLDQAARVSSLGRLAASMAHEFNNVLMGIQPFTEIIRRRAIDPAAVLQACDHIASSVRRGRTVSQEILRFTQPAEPSLDSVNVRQWLEDVAIETRGMLGPDIRLVIEGPQRELHICADRHQITQVITNLLLNARDAMASSGTIVIHFQTVERRSREFVDIQVTDTGAGIPEADRENIFMPLFTTKKNGTGLGLAVTHQIVSRHGGFISYDSEAGVGTTFHVLFQTCSGTLTDSISEASTHQKQKGHILLVEDEQAVAAGLTILLEMEGFTVDAVSLGADALTAAERRRPDVAVVDIGLPDMDGGEVGEALAEKVPGIAVIFSTGHADAKQLKLTDRMLCIHKPYESSALLTLIDEVLARPMEKV